MPTSVAAAQKSSPQLPCKFSGEILRTKQGTYVQYTSDEMKQRAIHKVDASGFLWQADIKGTAMVDVLVGTTGEVVCVKSLNGHPVIRVEIEKALRAWKINPAEVDGKRIAYPGRLAFTLCNISCGDKGASITLLE